MRAAEGRGLDDVEDPALPIAVAGLRAIGLTVIEDDAAVGFVPGVRIAGGTLRYAPGATDSNLLHEAGHLASLPENLRPLAEDDLSGVWEAIRGEFQTARCADPDAPYPRADPVQRSRGDRLGVRGRAAVRARSRADYPRPGL